MTPHSRAANLPSRVAGYPVRRLAFRFGDVSVGLVVVERLENYVDRVALLRDADAPEPPYWAHVWTASRALARLVATRIVCAERRIVEIGCGVGLVGIVAALRGGVVSVLDAAHEAVHFARVNAAVNGCAVAALQTDLRCPGVRGAFDLCLAADVTYDPSLQVALASFLADHLAPGGTAWCAESVRTYDVRFREACERHGLDVSEGETVEVEDGREVPVRITIVQSPRSKVQS